MHPAELESAPKFETFHHPCVSLVPAFVNLPWFSPKTIAFVTVLSPLSRHSILVTGSGAECRLGGRLGSLPLRAALSLGIWSSPSLRSGLCVGFGGWVVHPRPMSPHPPHLHVMETLILLCFFTLSVHSSPCNLLSRSYFALLFIMHLQGFIICGLPWDISFMVDEACKLWGRRSRGPYSNPHLSS